MPYPSFNYSGVVYPAPAPGAKEFSLTTSGGRAIGYLDPSHVHVYRSDDAGTTLIELLRPGGWDFSPDGRKVILATGVIAGQGVMLKRITPELEPYVVFGGGTLLTSDQLNEATLFNLYLNQEHRDAITGGVAVAGIRSVSGVPPIRVGGTLAEAVVSIDAATAITPGSMSPADKAKLDGLSNYALPIASAATLGGIKAGSNVVIDPATGALSAQLTGVLTYKGLANVTLPVPAVAAVGQVYVNSATGAAHASWAGLTGTVNVGEMLLFDGTAWGHVGAASAGVQSVTGSAPVRIGGTAALPDVSVDLVAPSVSGTGGSPGLISASDKEKLDKLDPNAASGTVTSVAGTGPVKVSTPNTTPTISIDDATSSAFGLVRLADQVAVAAGTAGRVVDAAQLKEVATTASGAQAAAATADAAASAAAQAANAAAATANGAMPRAGGAFTGDVAFNASIKLPTGTTAQRPAGAPGVVRFNTETGTYEGYADAGWVPFGSAPDATTTSKGIVQLADVTAIAAGTAGRVVDAAQLKASMPGAATTATSGLVQLADAAAISAGAAGRVVDAAQLRTATSTTADKCKAWVNFNGTGTVAIRASYNVSSITDNGTGDYTVNFATAMADANYASVGIVRFTSNGSITLGGHTGSATWQQPGSVRVNVLTTAGNLTDAEYASVAIFR